MDGLDGDILHDQQISRSGLFCKQCQEGGFLTTEQVQASFQFVAERQVESQIIRQFLQDSGLDFIKIPMDGLCIFSAIIEGYKRQNASGSTSLNVDTLLQRVVEELTKFTDYLKNNPNTDNQSMPEQYQVLSATLEQKDLDDLVTLSSITDPDLRRTFWINLWDSTNFADMVFSFLMPRQKINFKVWHLSSLQTVSVMDEGKYNKKDPSQVFNFFYWSGEDEGWEHYDMLVQVA